MSTRSSGRRRTATRAVHGPTHDGKPGVNTPIVHATTFAAESFEALLAQQARGAAGAFYQRVGHPTLRACEERLAGLEGAGAAVLFASGMAAVSAALLANLRPGDHVIALAQCYGGTIELLHWGAERWGWRVDWVDARTPERWEQSFRPETRVLHVESPTNPTLAVVDLAAAAALAHAHQALLTVDNTVASPIGQPALAHGADLVVYSATKSIGGHSDLLAGAVLGDAGALAPVVRLRQMLGGVPAPQTAWLIERSLKTLPLRVRTANDNALELARRLAADRRVARVFYPGLESHPGHATARRQMPEGFGPLMAFELVHADRARATAFLDRLKVVLRAPSLGSVESLASLPAVMSHRGLSAEERARADIGEGLVRMSVGIEDVDDLWEDLDQALD